MKITLIVKRFDPSYGGAERYSEGLARMLQKLGHEIDIWSDSSKPASNFSWHIIPKVSKWTLYKLSSRRKKLATALTNIDHGIIYALTAHYPVDVYRAGDGVYLHWMHIKYPYLLTRLLMQSIPKRWEMVKIERNLYKIENCRFVITNSELVKRHIQIYYNYPASNIHVIYNGVDSNYFQPGTLEQKNKWKQLYGISKNKLILLFVAHNWARKGLETLLRGAAKLVQCKKAVIVVVGRGQTYAWQYWLSKLKIKNDVYFVGTTADILLYYQAADIFILPTQYDPFANVTLEAMACGLPVITSQENGASEIIQRGENGYILSSPNAYLELETILDTLTDEQRRYNIHQQARNTARKFTLEINAQKTLEILHTIAKHKGI